MCLMVRGLLWCLHVGWASHLNGNNDPFVTMDVSSGVGSLQMNSFIAKSSHQELHPQHPLQPSHHQVFIPRIETPPPPPNMRSVHGTDGHDTKHTTFSFILQSSSSHHSKRSGLPATPSPPLYLWWRTELSIQGGLRWGRSLLSRWRESRGFYLLVLCCRSRPVFIVRVLQAVL